MPKLTEMKCGACRADSLRVPPKEAMELCQQLPGWSIEVRDGVEQLERHYKVDDFAQALALTNQIAELAESEQHHPSLLTEWGTVTVTWWTHKIKGLHHNDFIMAARTEMLYSARD